MSNLNKLLIVVIVTTLSCCEEIKNILKPNSPLRPYTENGSDRGGYYFNDVPYNTTLLTTIPRINWETCKIIFVKTPTDRSFSFELIDSTNTLKIVDLVIDVHDLTQGPVSGPYVMFYYNDWSGDSNVSLDYESVIEGQLEIRKFDTINKIVAGTFYCEFYDDINMDTIRIDSGRFDAMLKLIP